VGLVLTLLFSWAQFWPPSSLFSNFGFGPPSLLFLILILALTLGFDLSL
jgi:hypothetical protein